MLVRVGLVVLLVVSIPAALLLVAAVAANYRGPYRRDDDLTDTRPRRPTS